MMRDMKKEELLALWEESIQLHIGHRLRLREKEARVGFEMLPAHEALEIVLYAATPRGNTNEIAHALIDAFGSFQGVFNASEPELLCVKGVGKHIAELICAYGRAVRVYKSLSDQEYLRLHTRSDAVAFAEKLFYNARIPQTWLVLVDKGGTVIYTGRIFAGAMWLNNSTRAFIVERALAYRAHNAVIMAWRGLDLHGIFPADRYMVQELSETLAGIKLTVMDYLVVTPWRTISLRRDLAPIPTKDEAYPYSQSVRETWLTDPGDVWEIEPGENVVFPPAAEDNEDG